MRSRIGRKVTWNMSEKYSQGWQQGITEQLAEDEKRFHAKVTYSEIWKLMEGQGRITLRKNTYPMVIIHLSVFSDDFYYVKAIGEKHMWSRFQQWAKGTVIQLIWEGENAQTLIRKVLRYIDEETEMRLKALQALKWLPRKGGAPEPEIEIEKISVW